MLTFPPRPYMPHELPALHISRLAPQTADMRTYCVERRLPVDTSRQCRLAMTTQFAQQLFRAADAVILGKKIHPTWWLAADMGQQSVPGKHLDRPAMSGLFQRHHG